jgi:hypothetical protein
MDKNAITLNKRNNFLKAGIVSGIIPEVLRRSLPGGGEAHLEPGASGFLPLP